MSNAPPADIPATQLWIALSSHERPSKVVDFPRFDLRGEPVGQLRIRILTQEEQMICAAAAEKVAKEHLKDGKRDEIGYERLYTDALCLEVLFRACRDEKDVNRPAFPSIKQMRQVMTTEECAALFEHYLTVQLELGPVRATMSDEEAEAWITKLAEGGSAFPFDLLSSDLQKLLLLDMALQLRSSPTGNSSVTQPLDDSSESTSSSE